MSEDLKWIEGEIDKVAYEALSDRQTGAEKGFKVTVTLANSQKKYSRAAWNDSAEGGSAKKVIDQWAADKGIKQGIRMKLGYKERQSGQYTYRDLWDAIPSESPAGAAQPAAESLPAKKTLEELRADCLERQKWAMTQTRELIKEVYDIDLADHSDKTKKSVHDSNLWRYASTVTGNLVMGVE